MEERRRKMGDVRRKSKDGKVRNSRENPRLHHPQTSLRVPPGFGVQKLALAFFHNNHDAVIASPSGRSPSGLRRSKDLLAM